MSRISNNLGFTLIELMVVVAMTGIIAMFAIPSFQRLIEDNRVTTQTNSLLGALQLARGEAVKRSTVVTVAAEGASFEAGWCVTLNANCAAAADQVRSFGPVQGSSIAADALTLSFGANGEPVGGGSITIDLEPEDCVAGEVDRMRRINVNVIGRAAVSRENCA